MTEPRFEYENQPYLKPALELGAALMAKGKTGIHHIVIEHDDWCPARQGIGYCVCRPVVRSATRAERRRLRKGLKL